MSHIIIGTAGHVDHGKTALIRALTGINTDRLEEEQKRGITINLGFAHLPMPDGSIAGIVDVPGHEKFIKNMLAGAGGMDLVLLVVAADDGVMPQTREHLDILNLLDARAGIIVLTKTDLVEPDWVELVSDEIRNAVSGTFLADAPIMPVSSYTGEGIDALRAQIYQMVETAKHKSQAIPCRLPVDRVFSVGGFGSVVTGTLTEGVLHKGDEIMVYPSGQTTRVRNLQVHSKDVDTAFAGQRVAVNLAGLERNDIARGDTLAAPASMANSLLLDVKLKILKSAQREIKHGSRLHFYHGARDTLCRLVLLEKNSLAPGEEGYAQLRFSEEIALKKGDHFIVRFYSPLETVGGGIVLNPTAVKHKRGDSAVIEGLKVREHGSVADHIEQAITDAAADLAPLEEIRKQLDIDKDTFQAELEQLTADKRVLLLGKQNALSTASKAETAQKLKSILSDYHQKYPLQTGMRRDELRGRLFPGKKPSLCDYALDVFAGDGLIRYQEQKVALSGFTVTYSEHEEKIRQKIDALFAEKGFTSPSMEDIYTHCSAHDKKSVDRVFDAMASEGAIAVVTPGIFFLSATLEEAKSIFRTLADQNDGSVTLAQFRDRTGTSRKYALSLLEYFDRSGLTRKVGDARIPVKL